MNDLAPDLRGDSLMTRLCRIALALVVAGAGLLPVPTRAATALTPSTVDIAQSPLYGRNQRCQPEPAAVAVGGVPDGGRGVPYRHLHPQHGICRLFPTRSSATTIHPARYFEIAGNASANHECSGQYSGNFMNWATASAIDMLRFALTGGDRVVDTPTDTVLQRAVLQDDFFNSGSLLSRQDTDQVQFQRTFRGDAVHHRYALHHVVQQQGVLRHQDWQRRFLQQPGSYANLGTMYARVKVCDASAGSFPHRPLQALRHELQASRRNAEKRRPRALRRLRLPERQFGHAVRRRAAGPDEVCRPQDDRRQLQPGQQSEERVGSQHGRLRWQPGKCRRRHQRCGQLPEPVRPLGQVQGLDPVSELYYESIRYLQGKQPTPEAITDLQTAYKDGYPVYTSWSDPVVAKRQRNYVLSIADIDTLGSLCSRQHPHDLYRAARR
ncbi:hypothetical protein ACU4GD_35115 [Cupriavidus basilensis]